MISPENFIFDAVADVLREKFDGIYVAGEYIDVPVRFPAVTIVEASNTVVSRMQTLHIENAVTLMYETNVYSNVIGYKKMQAKEIQKVIDEVFAQLGFIRMVCNPEPNLQDASIYRIFARYQGIDMPEYDGENINHRIYTS